MILQLLFPKVGWVVGLVCSNKKFFYPLTATFLSSFPRALQHFSHCVARSIWTTRRHPPVQYTSRCTFTFLLHKFVWWELLQLGFDLAVLMAMLGTCRRIKTGNFNKKLKYSTCPEKKDAIFRLMSVSILFPNLVINK